MSRGDRRSARLQVPRWLLDEQRAGPHARRPETCPVAAFRPSAPADGRWKMKLYRRSHGPSRHRAGRAPNECSPRPAAAVADRVCGRHRPEPSKAPQRPAMRCRPTRQMPRGSRGRTRAVAPGQLSAPRQVRCPAAAPSTASAPWRRPTACAPGRSAWRSAAGSVSHRVPAPLRSGSCARPPAAAPAGRRGSRRPVGSVLRPAADPG